MEKVLTESDAKSSDPHDVLPVVNNSLPVWLIYATETILGI